MVAARLPRGAPAAEQADGFARGTARHRTRGPRRPAARPGTHPPAARAGGAVAATPRWRPANSAPGWRSSACPTCGGSRSRRPSWGTAEVMPFQERKRNRRKPRAAHVRRGGRGQNTPVRMLLALERLALAEDSAADGLVRIMSTFERGPEPARKTKRTPTLRTPPRSPRPPRTSWTGPGPPRRAVPLGRRADPGRRRRRPGAAHRRRRRPRRTRRTAPRARALGLRAWVAAGTADGRRRLADASAVTVAGLLAEADGPGRAEDGSLALDLLIVQDAPRSTWTRPPPWWRRSPTAPDWC